MAKIVITGAAGFIGSNLADRLVSRGHDVVAVDNLSYGIRSQIPDGAAFVEADIRDPMLYKIIAGADAIFHLAAKNCIADCQTDPAEAVDINVRGTANLLEAALRAGVRRIIYAESSAVYEGCDIFPSREDVTMPLSFYAISKSSGAALVDGYARYRGIAATTLRYFGVYGPRQDYRRTIPPVMSAFMLHLLRGEPPTIYGTGEKKRDFIFVDDVNDFHELCLTDRRTVGETFNLGSGEAYSVNEIYQRLSALLGTSVKPIRRNDLEGEAQVTLGDIAKARSLGWQPRVSLDEGLQRSIDFIRSNVLAELQTTDT